MDEPSEILRLRVAAWKKFLAVDNVAAEVELRGEKWFAEQQWRYTQARAELAQRAYKGRYGD